MALVRKRDIAKGVFLRYWWVVAMLLLLWTILDAVFVHVEPGSARLTWQPFGGNIGLMNRPGWYTKSPLTFSTEIDIRPQRLCLSSTAHSAPNCRLVQFDTKYYREFVAVEGWHWFWWNNRFSFNSGYDETYRGWRDIERGYAFSAQPYPFIHVIESQ